MWNKMVKIKKVAVLMGGFSSEREISLKSGTAVVKALREAGYEVTIVDFDNVEQLLENLSQISVDCVFNALHGKFGEDGGVQKVLDVLRIPYTGSGVEASRLAMDKAASHKVFMSHGLLVPEFKVLNKKTSLNKGFFSEFPLVIKPSKEGSSIGLSIVDDGAALLIAIDNAFRLGDEVLIEKFIPGREVTVGILDDEPLPIIEVVPKKGVYDYHAKYTAGMTEYIVPANLPEDIAQMLKQTALTAHQLLGCRCYSRVDIILGKDNRAYVLEVNTIPGMTATSLLPKAAAASGISFTQLCEKMLYAAVHSSYEKILLN